MAHALIVLGVVVISFSTATITHMFEQADGTAASGSIEFTLTKRMSQSGVTIVPSTITATLVSGALSQQLTANNDPGTIPGDATWRVDIRLDSDPLTYYITVPTGGGTIDLYSLLPQGPDSG